jgi:hypothetical protein
MAISPLVAIGEEVSHPGSRIKQASYDERNEENCLQKTYFILHSYFFQNKYVPHTKNSSTSPEDQKGFPGARPTSWKPLTRADTFLKTS